MERNNLTELFEEVWIKWGFDSMTEFDFSKPLTEEEDICFRCGYIMKKMHRCHYICNNCGSHKDCSDMSWVW